MSVTARKSTYTHTPSRACLRSRRLDGYESKEDSGADTPATFSSGFSLGTRSRSLARLLLCVYIYIYIYTIARLWKMEMDMPRAERYFRKRDERIVSFSP